MSDALTPRGRPARTSSGPSKESLRVVRERSRSCRSRRRWRSTRPTSTRPKRAGSRRGRSARLRFRRRRGRPERSRSCRSRRRVARLRRPLRLRRFRRDRRRLHEHDLAVAPDPVGHDRSTDMLDVPEAPGKAPPNHGLGRAGESTLGERSVESAIVAAEEPHQTGMQKDPSGTRHSSLDPCHLVEKGPS